MSYTLNKAEQKLAVYLQKARTGSNRVQGVTDAKIGPQSGEWTDLQGIGGELAFCGLQNLYPDMNIQPRKSQDDHGDATLPDGRTVDVKTTHYLNGHLAIVPWKADTVDEYALMIGSFPTYRFAGIMPAAEAKSDYYMKDLGHGPTYAIPQGDLYEL